MANFKRKGPKSTRAGCMLCKPYKHQGAPLRERQRFGQTKQMQIAEEKISEVERGRSGRP